MLRKIVTVLAVAIALGSTAAPTGAFARGAGGFGGDDFGDGLRGHEFRDWYAQPNRSGHRHGDYGYGPYYDGDYGAYYSDGFDDSCYQMRQYQAPTGWHMREFGLCSY